MIRFAAIVWCLCLLLLARGAGAAEPEYRWLYLQMNLQVAENVAKVSDLLRRAAAAGYNGVVLADYKLNILDRVPDHYFRHAEQVRRLCAELHLELIPAVAAIGYSDGLLAHNPNLAEGLPVRAAPFVAAGGTAQLQSDLRDALPNGGFEQHREHAASGWNLQDSPGEISFIDAAVKHQGNNSLRWQRSSGTDYLNARVSRQVPVAPWRQYHAAVWIKTNGFEAASDVRLFAIGADGRTLSHSNLGVRRDQDWTEHHVVFNSLANESVRLYCGTWGLRGGQLWLDDLRLEETALVNLLRRPGCPLRVASATGEVFTEGRDFEELRDPQMGHTPYAGSFDVYHQPPVLRLTPHSRIAANTPLRVDFFHTLTIYDNQVCCCLAEPEVFQIIESQVRRVEQLLRPQRYFLSHDEIRVANWCDACRREGRTAGQLLAENMRQCVAAVRRVNPAAQLCVWSDMFDPHHNAVAGPFYLVNGDLAGSWEGLSSDMLVVNWNGGKPQQSLPWFTQRGHGQVLAGFYDHDPALITKWLASGRETNSRVSGVMYTTWQQDFTQLEAFARHAWGARPTGGRPRD